MYFAKAQALGNDFIIVDADQLAGKDASRVARQVCHRFFSLGADGLIVFRKTTSNQEPLFSMQVFNADGSEAELSGNGLRCLAALLVHQGKEVGKPLSIETLAGTKTLILIESKPPHYSFKLLMGAPVLDPSRIDFRPVNPGVSLVGYPLPVEDRICTVTVTSMGNPHWFTVRRRSSESGLGTSGGPYRSPFLLPKAHQCGVRSSQGQKKPGRALLGAWCRENLRLRHRGLCGGSGSFPEWLCGPRGSSSHLGRDFGSRLAGGQPIVRDGTGPNGLSR